MASSLVSDEGVYVEVLGYAASAKLFMLCVGPASEWIDADSSARHEDAPHFDVARIHQFPKVVEDYVHAVFMEVSVVAERKQIELEALAFHHFFTRDI